ncbi:MULTISPECIES: helix-turn-helix domain-containing protein [Bacteroidales]|jgi:transcriptional regulator with XRE-family HTH domain|uniref:XRE family transcriptional regulator n=5 Tax=Duncaniella TaxID=2518495 RepID=A0A4Z0V3F1_9BACT|nr:MULTISPECIES: helix-turn-helix domain-containing protein [Bacteroidales]TGG36697.1 XRE family transcriptional regulator [Duncaniella freteri]
MDLVSRLKQYLTLRGIGITQFADECDIPRPTASQLLAGRNKKVSDEIIGKIHFTYPDLSVTWLMFGEGDMSTEGNIATSEPENALKKDISEIQILDNKPAETIDEGLFSDKESQPEKTGTIESAEIQESSEEFSFGNNTFSFSHQAATADPHASRPAQCVDAPMPQSKPKTTVQGKDRRVTGIVVYYSDSTYESFIPDPDAKHPFMR